MSEVWKNIPDYDNYEVSNLGNVKSKRKLLKPSINMYGYAVLSLHNKGVKKQWKVHQLVALCFFDYRFENHSTVIDHINGSKSDNRLENLQLISQRENKSKSSKKTTSKYTGVYFQKKTGKYTVMIYINGKIKYLGSFDNQEDAKAAYDQELNNLILKRK